MALTSFQRTLLRLLAAQRIESGVGYLAGGVALTTFTGSSRISRDIDLFHDTALAVATAWETDHTTLQANGYSIRPIREVDGFVEAVVSLGSEKVEIQWTRDSAFRFFPLVTHDELGLTLHPFDLATNKVLAMVGRLEVRDWIDVIDSDRHIQQLGYLAWAACAKDPGFSPASILEEAGRASHYSAVEVDSLAFDGPPPDPVALSRQWRIILSEARTLIELLPPDQVGSCVLDSSGDLFKGGASELRNALEKDAVRFHPGSIHGALPKLVGSPQPRP